MSFRLGSGSLVMLGSFFYFPSLCFFLFLILFSFLPLYLQVYLFLLLPFSILCSVWWSGSQQETNAVF